MTRNYSKGEFVTLHRDATDVQKALNQWRHQYAMEIIHTRSTDGGFIHMLLFREPLPKE